MKKLFISLMILTFASGAFAIDLSEADSKDMYSVLSRWGARDHVRGDGKCDHGIRIQVSDIRCVRTSGDQGLLGCRLNDDLHKLEKTRTDNSAAMLAQLVAKHAGATCDDGRCLTAARLIRCWHPWNDKCDDNVITRRRFICALDKLRESK